MSHESPAVIPLPVDGASLVDRFTATTADALAACRQADADRLTRAVEARARAAADLEVFFLIVRRAGQAAADRALLPIADRLRQAERLGQELESAVRAWRDDLDQRLAAVHSDRAGMNGYRAVHPTRRVRLERRF